MGWAHCMGQLAASWFHATHPYLPPLVLFAPRTFDYCCIRHLPRLSLEVLRGKGCVFENQAAKHLFCSLLRVRQTHERHVSLSLGSEVADHLRRDGSD